MTAMERKREEINYKSGEQANTQVTVTGDKQECREYKERRIKSQGRFFSITQEQETNTFWHFHEYYSTLRGN